MCLTITVEAAATERDRLTAAAANTSGLGLHLQIAHPSKLSWAKSRPVKVSISENGGCACSLLSDEADWNAKTWALRPQIVEPLAKTLEALLQQGPPSVAFEALWAGDRPIEEISLGPSELANVVRTTGLGTKTRYIVKR